MRDSGVQANREFSRDLKEQDERTLNVSGFTPRPQTLRLTNPFLRKITAVLGLGTSVYFPKECV
jgi:hypothetical protein